MKKFKLLFALLLCLSLIACSSDTKEEEETISVNKGLLNTEITLPASLFVGEEMDEITADAEMDGVEEVIRNDDGSITYKMSKEKHEQILEGLEANILEFIRELTMGEEYPFIQDVEYNDRFTELTIIINQSDYENGFESLPSMILAAQAMYYQLFDGVDIDDYEVVIYLEDDDTSEVFGTIEYPEAFETDHDEM